MSLYHVYFSNDIFTVFIIRVAIMDQNVDILREIGHLRYIGVTWGGDELCHSLVTSLDVIVDTISCSNDALYNKESYRERKLQEYVDGLSYSDVKKIKISKQRIYSLFRVPGTDVIPYTGRAHISIEWCIFQPLIDQLMDRWYVIFYIPSNNNKELPL